MFGVIVIVIFVSYWFYVHVRDGVASINESNRCKENREPYYFDQNGNSRFFRLVSTSEIGFCKWQSGETVFYTYKGKQYRNPFQDRRMLEYERLKASPDTTQSYFMVDRWANDIERSEHAISGISPDISNKGVRLLPLKENLPVAVIVEFDSYEPEILKNKKYYMNPDTRELLFPVEGQNISPEEDKEVKKFWLKYLTEKEKNSKYNYANTCVISDWKKIENIYKANNLNWFDGHDPEDYKKVAL